MKKPRRSEVIIEKINLRIKFKAKYFEYQPKA